MTSDFVRIMAENFLGMKHHCHHHHRHHHHQQQWPQRWHQEHGQLVGETIAYHEKENVSHSKFCTLNPRSTEEQKPKELAATVTSKSYNSLVLSGFLSLWKKNILCDVTFAVGLEKIACHRLVLAAVSSYFREKFSAKTHAGETLELQNIDVEVFRSILEFAYTGQIELAQSNIGSHLVASSFFQIEHLQYVCENFASQNIAVSNCFDVLSFSKKKSFKLLAKNAIKFIETHLDNLSEDNDVVENNIESVLECFQENPDLKKKSLPMKKENHHLYLLRIIVRFISQNLALANDIPALLQRVNMPLIPQPLLKDVQTKELAIKDDALVQHMLDLAMIARGGHYAEEIPASWKSTNTDQEQWALSYSTIVDNRKNLQGLQAYPEDLEFNDMMVEPDDQLLSIELIFRPWESIKIMGGMTLRYLSGKMVTRGMHSLQDSCDRHVMEFEEGEFVTEVVLSTTWAVNSLQFFTNKNRSYGPYGNVIGQITILTCPVGDYVHLHGFTGYVKLTEKYPAFFKFGAIWACYNVNT